jgi:hypothetical protein
MSDDTKHIIMSGETKWTGDSVEDACAKCKKTIYHDPIEYYKRNGIENPEFVCMTCAIGDQDIRQALQRAIVLPETAERVALMMANTDKKVH